MPSKGQPQNARRAQVASACESCRLSKVKCSGKHPICARCRTRGTECRYDVLEEGMTRREYLRHELDGQRQELERKTAVLRVMQLGTDQEATETLARLRMGVTLDEVYDQLLEGDLNAHELSYTIDDKSTDATSMASESAHESSALMSGLSLDIRTNGMADGDAEETPQADGMMYGLDDDMMETNPMTETDWDDSYLYSPTSTCSLAEINRYSDPSNIDPALQTPQQRPVEPVRMAQDAVIFEEWTRKGPN